MPKKLQLVMQLTLNERRHLANCLNEKLAKGQWQNHILQFKEEMYLSYGDKPNIVVIGPGKGSPPPAFFRTIINKQFIWGITPRVPGAWRRVAYQIYRERFDLWMLSQTPEEERVWESLVLSMDWGIYRPYTGGDDKAKKYRPRESITESPAVIDSLFMKLLDFCEIYVREQKHWHFVATENNGENTEQDAITLHRLKKVVS